MVTMIAFNLEFARATTPGQVAERLAPYGPDVVCLCEVPGGEWTREMAEALGLAHHWVGSIASAHHDQAYPDQTGRYHGKFKALVSRWPLQEVAEHALEGTGWQPASVLLARTGPDGADLMAGALHIPSGAADPEHCSARSLGRVMERYPDGRVVLGGDYNDRPDSEPLRGLYRRGFRNPWLETGLDFVRNKTCNAWTEEDAGVIDHLLYRGDLRVLRAEILALSPPLSDHHPILAAWELL